MNIIIPVIPESLSEEEKRGVTPELVDALEEMFQTYTRGMNPVLEMEAASVNGEELHDLYLEAIGRYYNKDGDLFVITPLGVVNVSDMCRQLKNLL